MKKRLPLLVFMAVVTTSLVDCAWMYPTVAPIRTEVHPAVPGARAETLLILLPGRGNTARQFSDNGFITDVQAHHAGIDIVAVEAHLGYYLSETIVERVWTDVIMPARAQGYRHISIAGISMGGLGAVAIARQHADALDSLILLAPFLGPKALMEKISAQGGAARWKADDPKDPYQQLWTWLQTYADPSAKRPALTVGFGSGDRLRAGQRLLADLLPPAQVLEIPGGHDWTTWKKLWLRLWVNPAPKG